LVAKKGAPCGRFFCGRDLAVAGFGVLSGDHFEAVLDRSRKGALKPGQQRWWLQLTDLSMLERARR
jgi:hypothetical protein